MTGKENERRAESRGSPETTAADGIPEPVERTFTCVACGYGERASVAPLVASREGVCANCGDWTAATADREAVVGSAREVAAALSGPVLTERQALAYLLREVVGLERATTAEVMDTSASNVDNLARRGAEKVQAARRVLRGLAAVQGDTESTDDAEAANPAGVDDRVEPKP